MHSQRRRTLTALFILILVLCLTPSQECFAHRYAWPGDQYSYDDVYSNDWAYWAISRMRAARVVAGWYYPNSIAPIWDKWYFRPGWTANKGWYIQCLMEIYGTLEDHSCTIPNTNWSWDKRREFWHYANDAAQKGIIDPLVGYQGGDIRRDESFAWLLRAADAKWAADRLTDAEVNQILSRFPDQYQILPQYRKDVALCVKWGLVRGTDTGYLEPARNITRREVAYLLDKSASVRLQGPKVLWRGLESIQITASLIAASPMTVTSWTLRVGTYSSSGTFVAARTWFGSNSLPNITWDGKDTSGNYVQPGAYYFTLTANLYRSGYGSVTCEAVPLPIEVKQDQRFLAVVSGSTSPTGLFPVQGWVCGTVEWWQNPDTTPPKLYFYLDGQAIAVEQDGTGWFRFRTPSGTHTLRVEADLIHQEVPEAHRVKRFSATFQIQSRSAETVGVSLSKTLFYAGETVTIGTTYSLGYSPYWTAGSPRVLVIDSTGKTVRTLTGADVTWDGKDSAGNYCPNGTYTVKAEVTYQQPNARGSWTVSDSKTVEFRSFSISSPVVTGASGPLPPGITVPTGSLPVLVTPDTQLTVSCDTAGPAYSLDFVVGGTAYSGTPKNARGSLTNTWTATVGPGTQQHGATVYLTVNLRDQSGVVRATLGPLAFMVVDGRKVSGASSVVSGPGYAVSGGCVYLLLDVVGEPASAPVVTAFGKSVQAAWDLSRAKWVAKVDVPSTQADGTYTAQVSVPVKMSGWPDRTVTAAVPIDVKQERLTLGSTPPRFAPRLGQPFVIPLSLRPVTSPFSTTMAVKSPAGSTVLTRTVSGLPASLSWDGKDAAGNWCDAGGIYTVEIAVKSEYDPGAGFPKGTITLTRSVTVELPNTTETEEDAPVRLIR